MEEKNLILQKRIHMKIEVMAKKSGSYGKKVDKLRKKSRQVTEKK